MAQTWTLHTFKDNSTWIVVNGPMGWFCDGGGINNPGPYGTMWSATGDFEFNNPSWTWFHLFQNTCTTGQQVLIDSAVYVDDFVFSEPSGGVIDPAGGQIVPRLNFDIGGPNWEGAVSTPAADYTAGEYWFDFDQFGNARASSTQPSDFGKWAWDGTINPNYTGPLVAIKKRGKGHNK